MFFNGKDMHSGRQVSIPEGFNQTELEELSDFWKIAGKVNHIGIPVYFPSQAVHRTGGIAVTPATTFSNHGTASRSTAHALNFSQHGSHLLGTDQEFKSRLAREAVFAFLNTLVQSGLSMPGESATSLMRKMRIDNSFLDILLPEFDVLNPKHTELVWRKRGYYAYLHRLVSSLDL